MQLTINGQQRKFEESLTLKTLLMALQLDAERVAIEHNGDVLLKTNFAATTLKDGDILEIVQFVGGG